jgi:hypothetical protein
MIIDIEDRAHARTAIAVWDNEGGARGNDSMDHHYGRRVEADCSWTVYHVYTGVPAHVTGSAMTGLSRIEATSRMLFLNRRNLERRGERIGLPVLAGQALNAAECRS